MMFIEEALVNAGSNASYLAADGAIEQIRLAETVREAPT